MHALFFPLSETPSCRDPLFPHSCPPVRKALKPEEIALLYEGPIADFLVQRVSLFFFTLVIAYKTGYTFSAGQLPEGSLNPLFDERGNQVTLRSSLYASLIPQLMRNGRGYLACSDFARMERATVELPEVVGRADRLLRESLLIPEALALVNQAARGELSPKEGVLEFCRFLLWHVKEEWRKSRCPGERRVFATYCEAGERVFREIEKGSLLYDWLGIPVPDPEASSQERALRRKETYFAIQLEQQKMDRTVSALERIKKGVFPKGDSPAQDAAFRAFLVSEQSSGSDRIQGGKLYNFPGSLAVVDLLSREERDSYAKRWRELWRQRESILEKVGSIFRTASWKKRGSMRLPPLRE